MVRAGRDLKDNLVPSASYTEICLQENYADLFVWTS